MTTEELVAQQTAALPIQWKKGKPRMLMVTSRETGRWVMPKGWLMDGKKPWAAAEIEALEEAGAIGYISKREIGFYHYDKRLPDGEVMRCRVTVYPMIVEKLKSVWKERKQRKRHWFSPKKAARLVDEAELSDLLLTLTDKPHRQPVLRRLLKAG